MRNRVNKVIYDVMISGRLVETRLDVAYVTLDPMAEGSSPTFWTLFLLLCQIFFSFFEKKVGAQSERNQKKILNHNYFVRLLKIV
jgi:hypothetical protein